MSNVLRVVTAQNLGTMMIDWTWRCEFCSYILKVVTSRETLDRSSKFCYDEVQLHKGGCNEN